MYYVIYDWCTIIYYYYYTTINLIITHVNAKAMYICFAYCPGNPDTAGTVTTSSSTTTSTVDAGAAAAAAAVQTTIGAVGGVAALLAIAIVVILVLALCVMYLHRKNRKNKTIQPVVFWNDGDTCSIQSEVSQAQLISSQRLSPAHEVASSFDNKLYMEAFERNQSPPSYDTCVAPEKSDP